MIIKTNYYITLFFISIVTLFFNPIFSLNNTAFTIRVLLDEPLAEGMSWKLESEDGIIAIDRDNPTQKKTYKKTVQIELKNKQLLLNNKPCESKSISLSTRKKNGLLTFKKISYEGTFLLLFFNNNYYLMNIIESEKYVTSVVSKEGWPGWPKELNRAFSIICRTYVLSKVLTARTKRTHGSAKVPYDIKNTNIHQTYGGGIISPLLKEAVHETEGIIITHKNNPIEAMFDACCGSAITSKMHGIDFKKAPYLSRSYACTHCKNCKLYTWTASYTLEELFTALEPECQSLKKIKEFKISSKDAAGFVQTIEIKDHHKKHILKGKRLYSLLKKIKSTRFTVSREKKIITFHGKGYGHCLGVCQWGACAMVQKGHTYKEVISFYYPHTTLMKIR